MTGPRRSEIAPQPLVAPGTDEEALRRLAERRLRSRGLASPRLDHHSTRTLDPRPRLFEAGSWQLLETATEQRFRLLSALADDLYGPQRVLRHAIVPADVILANPAYVLAAAGWSPPQSRRLAFAAFDFVAVPGEGWLPVADRLCAPTELGRSFENREITLQLLGGAQHRQHVRRLAHFQAAFRQALALLAPDGVDSPRVMLLSPGPAHRDHPELAELARMLGYTLAEAADLTVRHGSLFLSSLSGLEAVHVLGRFVGDRGADPLENAARGTVGIAGLLSAARRGVVGVANSLGVELVETPALGAWWPTLSRFLLGEELATNTLPTWWCGQPGSERHVTENLAQLEIRGLDPLTGVVGGPDADAAELSQLRDALAAEPWRFSARAPLEEGTEIIRTFAVFDGEAVTVMPGGFATAVGAARLSADVWVPQTDAGRLADLSVRVVGLNQVDFAISLPSRAGEAMFWMGRQLERSEAIVRLVRTVLNQLEALPSEQTEIDSAGWLADLFRAVDRLTGNAEGEEPRSTEAHEQILDALCDVERLDGLPHTVSQLLASAGSARELLSVEVWDGLATLRESVLQLAEHQQPVDVAATGRGPEEVEDLRDRLDRMLGDLASVAGVVHESMLHGPGWRLLDAGRRIERAHNLLTLLDTVLLSDRSRDTGAQHELRVPDEILESLLTTGVSLVAYRRRHRSDLEAEAVLAILVLDGSNPRSVRHALAALVDDLAQLPTPQRIGAREATVERARALLDLVAALTPAQLTGPVLPDVLQRMLEALEGVEQGLQDVYLRHVTMARLARDPMAAAVKQAR